MASASVATAWSVPVLHGPSSAENLLTTLVAWARHKGQNPRSFQLVLTNGGQTLLLKGFDAAQLRDFLRYAEYSSIPALECGPPTPLTSPLPTSSSPAPAPVAAGAPGTVAPAASATPEAPSRPPTLSSSSIQMVLGTAQLLADRATDVHRTEHWVTSVLASPDLKPEQVGVLLRLIGDPGIEPVRIALAESPTLRSEGASILGVPPERIVETLAAWKREEEGMTARRPAADPVDAGATEEPGPGGTRRKSRKEPSAPSGSPGAEAPSVPEGGGGPGAAPPPPNDPETKLRVQLYGRGLESAAQRWTEVKERLRASLALGPLPVQSIVEGAVFINEEEARVAWVVPHSASAIVKALASYVQESSRLLREDAARRAQEAGTWVSDARRETFTALETARRATVIAARLGVEFRWVVLLSTAFDGGEEAGFGLPAGAKPPWETAVAPSAPPPAPSAPSGSVVKKKGAPPGPGFVAFGRPLDAALDPWLERAGIHVGLLRPPEPPRAAVRTAPSTVRPVASAPGSAPKVILKAKPSIPPAPTGTAPPVA